jgi:hypothetical protein
MINIIFCPAARILTLGNKRGREISVDIIGKFLLTPSQRNPFFGGDVKSMLL